MVIYAEVPNPARAGSSRKITGTAPRFENSEACHLAFKASFFMAASRSWSL